MKTTLPALALLLFAACTPRTNTATDVIPPGGKTPDPVKESPTPAVVVALGSPTPSPEPGAKGPIFLVRDSGKRCIAAPCPSWVAVNVESREEREITGVDLSSLELDAKDADAARRKLLAGQAWAGGEIKKVPKAGPAGDGTVLFVSSIHEAPPQTQK